jgi:diguanylate cyclase (GGDEF)-like protein/PAS domain S-box-containing protein
MYRVLLIESSHTQRFALAQSLLEAGYEPLECTDYWQAINLLRVAQPGEVRAVIMEWIDHEPELLSLLQRMLESPQYLMLPQLVLTESASPELSEWLKPLPKSIQLEHSQHNQILEFLALHLRQKVVPGAINLPDRRGESGVDILLVDESPHDRVRYQRILESAGFPVSVARNLGEVPESVSREHYFDIVIVDYFILDTAEGAAFFEKIRSNQSMNHLRSVVLISSYNDKAVQQALESGAVECVFKTETDALFLARIHSLVNQITVQKTAEAERRRFEAILGSVGEGVYGVDTGGRITFMNPAGQKMLGFRTASEFEGRLASELIHTHPQQRRSDHVVCDVLEEAYLNGAELDQWETIFCQAGNRKMNVACTVSPLDVNGHRKGSVVAFRDITERKRLEKRLIIAATRDPLTNLFNRRHFERALSREVTAVKTRSVTPGALLYIDFDRFKYLNDTAGHEAGDKVLVEASHRLRQCVRATDDVARLGGDEFAVILREVDAAEATAIAESIRDSLQEVAYISDEVSFKLSCSIGIAMIEPNLENKDVLANADIACGIAKRKGRNQSHVYKAAQDRDKESMNEEIAWSAKLKDALEFDHFQLYYQPILPVKEVDFSELPGEPNRLWASLSHLPDHYEVLLRLQDGENGLISPGAFLSMAERFKLIDQIDYWVVRESVRVLEGLHDEGRDASFSVNLSGVTLNTTETLNKLERLLLETRLPPSSLIFEITETSAIEKLDAARLFIERMRKRGWRFALDDFGTGFSSFSQLKFLPVDMVKIDGQFVEDMLVDPIDRAIVIAINEIAHSLGMDTVAEYVETPETLRLINELGIDYAQGFYISRPMTCVRERVASETQMLRLIEPLSMC